MQNSVCFKFSMLIRLCFSAWLAGEMELFQIASQAANIVQVKSERWTESKSLNA